VVVQSNPKFTKVELQFGESNPLGCSISINNCLLEANGMFFDAQQQDLSIGTGGGSFG